MFWAPSPAILFLQVRQEEGFQWGCQKKRKLEKPTNFLVFKKTMIWNSKLTTVVPSVSMFYSQALLSPHILSPHDRRMFHGAANTSDGAHLPAKENTWASLKALLNLKSFRVILCWGFIFKDQIHHESIENWFCSSPFTLLASEEATQMHVKNKQTKMIKPNVFCRSWQFYSRSVWL